jgi:hypothetical protein
MGTWKVVKRSGRDEPMWVSIHKCMEAMLGISLYRYLYLKLAKMLCFSYIFSSIKLEKKKAQQVLPRNGQGGEQGEVGDPNNVYTYK